MRCVIVVPTYNQAATIGDLLEVIDSIRTETAHVRIDVLVVDDNSPDGTQAVVADHPGFGWRCERHGLQLADAPITFTERCAGTSKVSTGVALETALLVLRWRAGELTHARATSTSWNAARHEGAERA
jgi:cellulose synthase/poly-beta-1,6-N-acetylglucosamine synthase-like glycosyltransferase